MQINLACVHSSRNTPFALKNMKNNGQENFNFIQKK